MDVEGRAAVIYWQMACGVQGKGTGQEWSQGGKRVSKRGWSWPMDAATSPGRELAQSGRVEPFPAPCSQLHSDVGLEFLCRVTELIIKN